MFGAFSRLRGSARGTCMAWETSCNLVSTSNTTKWEVFTFQLLYSFLGEIFKFQSIPWLICFYLQVADSAVSLSNLATALGFHTGQACDGEGEVEVTLGCPVPPFPPSKIQTVFPKVSWMVASHQLYKRRRHDDMLVSLDIVLSKKHVFQDATPAARGPPAAPRSCGVNKPPQCGGVSMVQ